MALADPQTVTVNAVAKTMPRITSNGQLSVYKLADGSFTLTVSHQTSAQRIRSMFRIDQRIVAADPLTSVNDWQTLSFYGVIDRPITGFTSTQVDQLVAGLKTWLDTTMVGKIFGGES